MKTSDEILDALGPAHRAAQLIGDAPPELRPKARAVKKCAVHQWRHRRRIPGEWFAAILHASKAHGLGITERDLIFHSHASSPEEGLATATRDQARGQPADHVAA